MFTLGNAFALLFGRSSVLIVSLSSVERVLKLERKCLLDSITVDLLSHASNREERS